jgi:uncharacterized membrane protein
MGRWAWVVAAAFSVSGVVHVVHPSTFTSIVPGFLPLPAALVVVSGVAELVCAVGLWRQRRWAGIASALLLLVIWPANLQMALDGRGTAEVIEWVRLPLQIPLIWCALQARTTSRVR